MTVDSWRRVVETDFALPEDRDLASATTQLLALLTSPDPVERDELAFPILATWIETGRYDESLADLGERLVAALQLGLGESGTDTVFGRSFAALVLGVCIEHDTERRLLPDEVVSGWSRSAAEWYLTERDPRGFVPDRGWAHALAHGADLIGALAGSPRLGRSDLGRMLTVIADRVERSTGTFLVCGEPDRMAAATIRILERRLLPDEEVCDWIGRLSTLADLGRVRTDGNPYAETATAEQLLRAIHLLLALTFEAPASADVRAALRQALATTNAAYLPPGAPA